MPRKVEVIHEDHVEAEKDAAEARALVLGRGELSDRGRLEALIKPYVFDDVDAWGRGAEAVLRDYFEDLRRVFRFYAASGEAGSADEMSVHEWMVFLGDCRIIDKRHAWCFRRGSPAKPWISLRSPTVITAAQLRPPHHCIVQLPG